MSESAEQGKIVRVRLGHGANCSSIGSVVDTLFVGAVLGTAIFAAVAAAMHRESVTVVGKNGKKEDAEAKLKTAKDDEEKVP